MYVLSKELNFKLPFVIFSNHLITRHNSVYKDCYHCDAFLMIVGSTHCKVNQQFDGVPTDCVFPFTYNGVTYRACTSANKTRCQFHQCFMSSFYAHRSQKHKKGWQLDCIFLLFACIKASHNFHQCYIRSFWPSRFTLILLLHGIEHIA